MCKQVDFEALHKRLYPLSAARLQKECPPMGVNDAARSVTVPANSGPWAGTISCDQCTTPRPDCMGMLIPSIGDCCGALRHNV